MDPVLVTAGVSLVTAALAYWGGRRQRAADADSTVVAAVEAATGSVQKTYQTIIADLDSRVVAAHAEATAARSAAREAQQAAAEAESQAWRADMRARAMERFLTELRPLIAAHVPGAEAILAQIDKLATPPARPL